jgi:hypothetical protein
VPDPIRACLSRRLRLFRLRRTRATVRVRVLRKDTPRDVVVWETVVIEGLEHETYFAGPYILKVDRWGRTPERIYRRRRLFGRT